MSGVRPPGDMPVATFRDRRSPRTSGDLRSRERRGLETRAERAGGSHNGTTPELLAAMTPKMAVISCGRWDFGKPAKKKEKPKQFTTFAFGHPRRSTIDMLVLAIPGEREQATKQVVFDAIHKKRPYAEFRTPTIRKRIYATAWDGTIEIQADLQGEYTVAPSNN